MTSFKIGNKIIKGKGILAPMLEFSNLPFRLLCRDNHSALNFTEMVHINHIASVELSQIPDLKSTEKDTPTAVQLVGDLRNKELTLNAAHKLDSYKHFDIIDFNLGCPSQKIVDGKSGSYLLKEVDSILDTLKEVKQTCKKPITVKTRLGFKVNDIENISKKIISTGIDALSIHARTKEDSYGVLANVDAVRKIKEISPIPIIYNGDVNDNNFKDFLDFPGIMIARSALGNPQIFKKIDYYLENQKDLSFSNQENLNQLSKFLDYSKKYDLEFSKVKLSSLQFLKGFKGASSLRNSMCTAKSYTEIIEILNKLKDQSA